MAKLKGKVVRSDLEGGFWTLEAEDGNIYKLEGGGGGLSKRACAPRSRAPSRRRWASASARRC